MPGCPAPDRGRDDALGERGDADVEITEVTDQPDQFLRVGDPARMFDYHPADRRRVAAQREDVGDALRRIGTHQDRNSSML